MQLLISNHPEIELLKYKSFLAVLKVTDKNVLSEKYLQHAVKVFRALHPFDKFLNDAIEKQNELKLNTY